MPSPSDDALRKGILAARRKDREAARTWLRRALDADADREEGWLWLSRVTDDPAEQRRALEEALRLNPDNRWAAEQLHALDTPAGVPAAPTAPTPRPEPRIEALQCPSCGGAVELHDRETAKTAVCTYCGSVLDLTPEQAAIVGQTDLTIEPLRPIHPGDRATLDGVSYEVTGWMRYQGRYGTETWIWDEWMLVGDDGSVRWLSYDPEDGFLLQTRQPITTPFDPDASRLQVGDGISAEVTERDEAELIALRGELTWQARVGDRIRYVEAERGDTHYSVEYSREEVELSAGQLVSSKGIRHAFGYERPPEVQRKADRRAAAGRALRFLGGGAALLFFLWAFSGCLGTERLERTLERVPPDTLVDLGTIDLTSRSRPHRVTVRCTDVSLGQWALVSAWAHAPDGTRYFLGSANCWHESGYEDGERWEESQTEMRELFKITDPGPYRFELALEEANYAPVGVIVEIDENAWQRGPFCFGAILLFVAIFAVVKVAS